MTPERYARIKEVFTQAADLSGQQRDAFLTRACDGDDQLRAEVESLLEHDYSRTLIASADPTLRDLPSTTVNVALRRTLEQHAQRLGNLTAHLGPRGHLAIGALIACLVLGLLLFLGNRSVERFQKQMRRDALNEILDDKVLALEMWIEHETSKIESWGRSRVLRGQINALLALANETGDPDRLKDDPIQESIRETLSDFAGRDVQYSVWDRRHLLVADTFAEGNRLGKTVTPFGSEVLADVFDGNSQLFAFDKKRSITELDPSQPVDSHMATITPVADDSGQIIAALLLHDRQSGKYASRILQMVHIGDSGETYVFNRDGLMLSESRFTPQLRELGLIPDEPDSRSARNLDLRDPGGDLTKGFVPAEPRSSQPLTEMARLCVAGNDGDNLDGYRDYRGVMVVGAWRWLEDLEIGVATELDFTESELGLQTLALESLVLVGLFATCMGITVYSYYSVHRIRQQQGLHGKLGSYVLEEQIGEGGMGRVYRAHHELLKRPTAVKLLKPELVDRESMARFEREANLVSQLEHPNTIRVYDYGVTPEGLLYYVMEYVDGLSLGELVPLVGKISPQRTIFLLRQICGSLNEAHNAGLVHRDLKPGNIMVYTRAGECDVVKVLDFGLVKPIETSTADQITASAMVAGTPQYIAPERLSEPEKNDPRSDIYSLGVLAFFLLTGDDFITGSNLAQILMHVVTAPPRRPSSGTTIDIPPALDELVLRCLAKDPDDRPQSVLEIIETLEDCEVSGQWTQHEARLWWQAFRAKGSANSSNATINRSHS